MLHLFVELTELDLSPVNKVMQERGQEVTRDPHSLEPPPLPLIECDVPLQQVTIGYDRVQWILHLVRNGGVYYLLK